MDLGNRVVIDVCQCNDVLHVFVVGQVYVMTQMPMDVDTLWQWDASTKRVSLLSLSSLLLLLSIGSWPVSRPSAISLRDHYEAFFCAAFLALAAWTVCTNTPTPPRRTTPATPGIVRASDRSGKKP